jgi:hypothetical protein
MKCIALLTTMAFAAAPSVVYAVPPAIHTLRGGGGMGADTATHEEEDGTDHHRHHRRDIEIDDDVDDVGIKEVGEQMMHNPPSNWDGMHGPSRRALIERQLDGDEDDEDEDVTDPFVDSDVVGHLIENDNVEVNDGLYDWEDDDERMMDKSYDPPIDSVTVSSHSLSRTVFLTDQNLV